MNELYQICRFHKIRGVEILSSDPNAELITSRVMRASQNTSMSFRLRIFRGGMKRMICLREVLWFAPDVPELQTPDDLRLSGGE